MESLFSCSLQYIAWPINYIKCISILICLIFIIRFIAAKRLPAWWSYSLWLILIVSMFIPWGLGNSLNISNIDPTFHISHVVQISADKDISGSTLFNNNVLKLGSTKEAPLRRIWSLPVDKALLFLWLAGAITFGMNVLVHNFRFWDIVKGRSSLTEKTTLELLEKCKCLLNIRKNVDVIVTSEVKSPALFGYIRPRLLLPEGVLERLNHEELAFIFMHEMAHLKRHDVGISWLMTIFQVVHWFNPLVWIAFHHMRIDLESACDAYVLSRIKQVKSVEYASAILGFLEKFCRNRQLPALAGIIENKNQIKRRIGKIATFRKYSKKTTITAVVLLIMTSFIFLAITGFAEEKMEESKWDQGAMNVAQEAHRAIQENDFQYAENIIRNYMATDPEFIHARMYMVLGYLHSNQGNLDDALKILEEGHKAYPDNDMIKERIMGCCAQQALKNRDFIEAGKLYEKIYKTFPNSFNRSCLATAVNSYFMAGNIIEAKRVYKDMVDLLGDPDMVWLERIIQTCIMLDLQKEAEGFKKRLRETDIYSVLLTSEDSKAGKGQFGNEDMETVYCLSDVHELPVAIHQIKPQYPIKAKEKYISGGVTLRFIVTKEGRVRNAIVIESVPGGLFDESALDAIMQYQFRPAIKNGEAVATMITTPIAYRNIIQYYSFLARDQISVCEKRRLS